MLLTSIAVRNYRSLGSVELTDLSNFNVLTGRNNAGKSAVFGAVRLIQQCFLKETVEWQHVLTNRDASRRLNIKMEFTLSEAQRDEFYELLVAAGYSQDRRSTLGLSPIARKLRVELDAPPGTPDLLVLKAAGLLAEDSEWANVYRVFEDTWAQTNPGAHLTNFRAIIGAKEPNPLYAASMDLAHGQRVSANPALAELTKEFFGDPLIIWPVRQFTEYIRRVFFFDPFRHGSDSQSVQQAQSLDSTGLNLPQRLNTIQSNHSGEFQQIEDFVHAVLPNVGALQTPLDGQTTQVAFRVPGRPDPVPLRAMGGGIEQLIMVAVVLHTTSDDHPLFLEEPESHLHPGAQRYLIERLNSGNRQVFLTTHSPTFVNASRTRNLYRVQLADGETSIESVKDPEGLSSVLDEIGVRNSDVLLSDAVLFVEGNSDATTLSAWSRTLSMSFGERGISVLPMGGGEGTERTAPVRTSVLEGISQKTPVSHLFIIDRDERTSEQLERLTTNPGSPVRILQRRELENYLLDPAAIREALREKCSGNRECLERLAELDEAAISKLLEAEACKLYDTILAKRIRNRINSVRSGLLPRELIPSIQTALRAPNTASAVARVLCDRFRTQLSELNLPDLVKRTQSELETEWSDPARHLWIAPGEELLEAVYRSAGVRYDKSRDAERIASAMRQEDIPAEIRELVEEVSKLAIPR